MADDGDGPEGAPAVSSSSSSALPVDDASMEDVLDKLKMLDYEEDFAGRTGRLSRTSFTRPAPNPADQFFLFASLVAWLLRLSGEPFPAPGQYDDPMATASAILIVLRKLGLNVKDVAPGRLRPGYGEAVLHVLTTLCDRALMLRGFRFRPPQWAADRYAEEEDVGADVPEELEDALPDGPSDPEEEEGRWAGALADGGGRPEPIESEADPAAWLEEAARVAPLLRLQNRPDLRDWRSHLSWTQSLLSTIERTFPTVRIGLEAIGEGVGKAVETLRKREQGLTEQCLPKVEDYKAHKKEHTAATERYQASVDAVAALSHDLSQVTEALEGLKGDIAVREAGLQDASAVGRIREVLSALREEVADMQLRIGMHQHRMLQHLRAAPTAAAGEPADPADPLLAGSDDDEWRT